MRKKILFAIVFSILIFSLKGLIGKPAQAANQATVMADLDNSAGTIPITVTVTYYHSGTSTSPGPQFDIKVSDPIPAGSTLSLYSKLDDFDSPYYWISWSTSCSDPPALAAYSGLWGDGIGPGVAAYQTDPQDVHCRTPNATPSINYTACARVGWTLTGVGVNGANISYFEVYRSTNSGLMGDSTTNPDPSTKMPGTLSASSRSVDWGSLADGTYYVRVRAVSPQGVGSWSSVNSFTCSSVVLGAASGLYANPSCNGTSTNVDDDIVAVNFGWNAASAGSTEQWLDYSVWNNNFAGGTYNSQSVAVGATSFNFPTGFPQGVRFYWRINNKIGGNWYPSVTANFLTPTCPPNAIWPTATAMPTSHPGQDCAADGCTSPTYKYSIPRPNSYWEMWGRKSDGTCDFSYSGTTSGLSASKGLLSFCGGQTVYWRVYPVSSSNNAMRGWDLGDGTVTAAGDGSASISWSWAYTVRIYLTGYNYGDSGSKSQVRNVGANSETTFCNGTASGCTGTLFTGLNGGASYQRTFCVPNCNFGAYATTVGFTSGDCNCPTPGPTPTPVPVVITLSGYSNCVDGVNSKVHLTWTSNSGGTGYTVFRDGTNVTAEGLPNPLGGAARSWDSTAAQPAGAHNWMVRSTGGTFDPKDSSTLSVTTATCSPPPADPSNLVISSVCNAATGLPEITFTWTDNSNIEQGFWMDVSHDAFTGPSSTTVSPSVWGVKGITRSGAETTATGGNVQFLWNNAVTTNTAGQLDSGDVDSAVAGNQLAPEKGVTYYWRVKAYSADRQSNHVYPGGADGADADTIPDGSTTPPGVAFTTPNCMFDLEVTNNPPPGNVQVYDPGGTVTFKVQVTNTTVAQVAYPGGGNLGAWTQSNLPNPGPNCAGTSVTPAPNPPTNTVQSIAIPTLGIGASTIITLANFTAPSTPGSYIANFYALPTCVPNNDLNWTNNGFQLTYVVSAKAWFQTQGGDVGARGSIAVNNPSVPLYSQSSWVLAGNPIDSKVSGKWELNNYSSPIFPTNNNTKVYDYMNSRFRSKATEPLCTANFINLAPKTGNHYFYCTSAVNGTGDVDVGGDLSTVAGTNNWVMFVDGNLTVSANFKLASDSTMVFIVRGNVTVNTNVMQADGVYIAGGTFADYDNAAGKSRNTTPYKLTINGAVYAHSFDLSAFLSGLPACVTAVPSCDNSTTPTDSVIFQPKYLIILSQLIGSPSVSWQEVAP